MDWHLDFVPITYKDPAPQNSVFPFNVQKLEEWTAGKGEPELAGKPTFKPLLSELEHQRETIASKKTIAALHKALSNGFRLWLEEAHSIKAIQERNRIDLTFVADSQRHIAELKVCYALDTRHAIREALGQLFEYNHYPSFVEASCWWLVLDCNPSDKDFHFITTLIERYKLPLTMAWPSGANFMAFPSLPFKPA
ncbi:MAG: hypothetical protein ABSF53_08730 [Terracidiphilus sp.]